MASPKKEQPASLSRAPNEPWLIIQGHLDPIDQVALALTCKRLLSASAISTIMLPSSPAHKGPGTDRGECKNLPLLLARVRPLTPSGLLSPDLALCRNCQLYRPTWERYWVAVGETYARRLRRCYYREAAVYAVYVKGLIGMWKNRLSTEVACPGCQLEARWEYFERVKRLKLCYRQAGR
ncbi:hypothetical protein PG993_006258 [Apiospora rasikravindrae]|uniref:Uncharacterized protein n=1 Tax=Apiospora rasikravindrae TaxID=990691 RepID=A0ABR1T6Z7_9PEZI